MNDFMETFDLRQAALKDEKKLISTEVCNCKSIEIHMVPDKLDFAEAVKCMAKFNEKFARQLEYQNILLSHTREAVKEIIEKLTRAADDEKS